MTYERYKLNIEIECISTSEARTQMQNRLSNLNFKELFSGKNMNITYAHESIDALLHGDNTQDFVFDVKARVIEEKLPINTPCPKDITTE